jgi:apolipoprotein N-acyltransferase
METLQAARRTVESGLSSAIRTDCLSQRETVCWVLMASVSFHAAYFSAATAFLIVVYLFALVRLACVESWRRAFYTGLIVGLLIAVGRLDFLWHIFSLAALALWLVYAFWIGLFVAVARLCLKPQFRKWGMLLVPFVWCGLEYFRSELYYLRFSWLSPGLAFGIDPSYAPIAVAGTFGTGFLLMIIAEASALMWIPSKGKAIAVLMAGVTALYGMARLPHQPTASPAASLRVAGVQLEFPSESEIVTWLNELVRRHPDADLLVLSEYTFLGPIPEKVRNWCREHSRYLLIGGEDTLANHQFYDTAFVISPSGDIVFHQAKSVPIQFFNDGLPALEQSIWQSPWGKIGICICYDLSYTRVTDSLVRMGAEMLIVPTMDLTDWGKRQHELHARMGPIRAAEYHLPVVRLASSGISQAMDPTGKVLASAPCPGQGAIISATLNFSKSTRLPPDRWLAPGSAALTGFLLTALSVRKFLQRRTI